MGTWKTVMRWWVQPWQGQGFSTCSQHPCPHPLPPLPPVAHPAPHCYARALGAPSSRGLRVPPQQPQKNPNRATGPPYALAFHLGPGFRVYGPAFSPTGGGRPFGRRGGPLVPIMAWRGGWGHVWGYLHTLNAF